MLGACTPVTCAPPLAEDSPGLTTSDPAELRVLVPTPAVTVTDTVGVAVASDEKLTCGLTQRNAVGGIYGGVGHRLPQAVGY